MLLTGACSTLDSTVEEGIFGQVCGVTVLFQTASGTRLDGISKVDLFFLVLDSTEEKQSLVFHSISQGLPSDSYSKKRDLTFLKSFETGLNVIINHDLVDQGFRG